MASRSRTSAAVRAVAAQALSRAAGAPLVEGNTVRLLRDAAEHFPAMRDAIASAERSIFLDSYIIADDHVTQPFAKLLAEKASAGVKVRIVHDWLGSLNEAGRSFYRPMEEAGVMVRRFNPPRFDSPFAWLRRDHRKMLAVDGRVGIVTGLCLSARWEGDPSRGIEPWRDTGIEFSGPALVDLEEAFGAVWAVSGTPLDPEDFTSSESIGVQGDVPLRVIATTPAATGLYRLDHLVAAMAQRTLWLADAYFVGVAPYVQALCSAAEDGVDVRLLVPGASDLPLISPMSRAGYRPLLEAGVRVFEWNGSMMHAKTAVADGQWARVGSTNLNIQSWMGNWELDVAIEHPGFAQQMEQVYEADLQHSTEVVLSRRWYGVRPTVTGRGPGKRWRVPGSTRAAAAGAMRVGRWVSAAITSRRELGPAEAKLMASIGIGLLLVGALFVFFPRILSVPIAVLAGWVGIAALLKAWALLNTPPPVAPRQLQSSPPAEVVSAPTPAAPDTHSIESTT